MRLGRYEVVSDLGSGGMGGVRLAKSPGGSLVVLKTAHDRRDDERLLDEARVGLRLAHDNIVETLDLFEHEGRPVLVTAYVSGATLFELRRHGPLPPGVVCRIGSHIAQALDALHHAVDESGHSLEMLHRDVTPSNILLGHDGRARLIDLGIARSRENRAVRTDTGMVRGTLRYMAPELYDGGSHSPGSDLWSLGVSLWEALLGRPAVRGTEAEIVGRIVRGTLLQLEPQDTADERVVKLIRKLLSQEPHRRPRRARDGAAMFAMTEKGFADGPGLTQLAQRIVWRAIGPDAAHQSEQDVARQAAQTFCPDPERRLERTGLVDEAEAKADALRRAEPTAPVRHATAPRAHAAPRVSATASPWHVPAVVGRAPPETVSLAAAGDDDWDESWDGETIASKSHSQDGEPTDGDDDARVTPPVATDRSELSAEGVPVVLGTLAPPTADVSLRDYATRLQALERGALHKPPRTPAGLDDDVSGAASDARAKANRSPRR